MKKKHIIGIIIGLLTHSLFAQYTEPYSFTHDIGSETAVYNMNVDLQYIQYTERTYTVETETGDTTITTQEPVIGETFTVNLNPLSHGTWNRVENGDSLYRLQINTNGGIYLTLMFDDFYLPEGTSLFVYSSDRTNIVGVFTHENNTPQRKFSTTPIKATSIILEYYKPHFVTEQEKLSIAAIGIITQDLAAIATKNFAAKSALFGDAASCMINAKCSQYEDWCNQRRSVAMIIIGDPNNVHLRQCTGSLLTNERRDGKPFFLTAYHCLDMDENGLLSQTEIDDVNYYWHFIFNYQSSDCNNPSSEPALTYDIVGATYINSISGFTDYALLQLNQKPPKNFNAYYNGWSNDNNDMTNTGVCIHHPAGDIKKISEWEKKSTNQSTKWKVEMTAGGVEGGSSGAPLLNNNHYVMGQQMSKVGDACDNNNEQVAYFGRLDKSWHDYGLSWELNPNGQHSSSSGSYISSMSGDETCKDNWYFNSGNDLHTSANVSFLNMATVGTRQYDGVYNAKNSIVAETNVNIQLSTTVVFEAGQIVRLKPGFRAVNGSRFTAKIGDCEKGCGNGFKRTSSDNNSNQEEMKIVQKSNEINVNQNNLDANEFVKVFPNPNNGNFNIELSPLRKDENVKIQILNSLGQKVFEENSFSGNEIQFNNPNLGIYFISITFKDKIFTQKIVVQ